MGLEQQGWGPVGLNRAAHFRALQLEWVKLTPDDKDVSIEQRTSARCNTRRRLWRRAVAEKGSQ